MKSKNEIVQRALDWYERSGQAKAHGRVGLKKLKAELRLAVDDYGEKVLAAIFDRDNREKYDLMMAAKAKVDALLRELDATESGGGSHE